MATERSTIPGGVSIAKWAGWLGGVVALWVLVSPFVLSGSVGSQQVLYSNVIAGLIVLVLGVYAAYALRVAVATETNSPAELGGWLGAVLGLWIAASPFVLTGDIATGLPMWSNVVTGLVAAILVAYAGYTIHRTD